MIKCKYFSGEPSEEEIVNPEPQILATNPQIDPGDNNLPSSPPPPPPPTQPQPIHTSHQGICLCRDASLEFG